MTPANRDAFISDLYAFLRGKKHFLHIALDKRIGCELATEQQQRYWYDKIEMCSLLFYILEEALYYRG